MAIFPRIFTRVSYSTNVIIIGAILVVCLAGGIIEALFKIAVIKAVLW